MLEYRTVSSIANDILKGMEETRAELTSGSGTALGVMKQRAFTLIELLVVVAIIGLLAAIVIGSLNTTRMKGRDARRIADLAEIRNALELFNDSNGYYPRSQCGWDSNCGGYWTNSYDSTWTVLGSSLAPYIATLPKDPINNNPSPYAALGYYGYAYGDVGRYTQKLSYNLITQLEDPNNPQRCGLKGYKFYWGQYYWCTAFGGSYSNQIYDAGSY